MAYELPKKCLRELTCFIKRRNVYRVLVGKPEGKGPLGGPRRRWEDGIRMDLREIGWEV
jgi:hypothetical protein